MLGTRWFVAVGATAGGFVLLAVRHLRAQQPRLQAYQAGYDLPQHDVLGGATAQYWLEEEETEHHVPEFGDNMRKLVLEANWAIQGRGIWQLQALLSRGNPSELERLLRLNEVLAYSEGVHLVQALVVSWQVSPRGFLSDYRNANKLSSWEPDFEHCSILDLLRFLCQAGPSFTERELRFLARVNHNRWEYMRLKMCLLCLRNPGTCSRAVMRIQQIMPTVRRAGGPHAANRMIEHIANKLHDERRLYLEQLPESDKAYAGSGEMDAILDELFRVMLREVRRAEKHRQRTVYRAKNPDRVSVYTGRLEPYAMWTM